MCTIFALHASLERIRSPCILLCECVFGQSDFNSPKMFVSVRFLLSWETVLVSGGSLFLSGYSFLGKQCLFLSGSSVPEQCLLLPLACFSGLLIVVSCCMPLCLPVVFSCESLIATLLAIMVARRCHMQV